MERTLKELRQRLHEARKRGRALVEAIARLEAKESLSDEESAELSRLEAEAEKAATEVEHLAAEVEQAERALDRARLFAEGAMEIPEGARITTSEPDPRRTGGFTNLAEFARTVGRATPGAAYDPAAADRLREAMQAIGSGPRAAPANFMQEQGAGEGYMVPAEFRDRIWEIAFSEESILAQVDLEPTASNAVSHNRDETTPWGASGVQARWRSESSQMTATKLATEHELLRLNELYAFVTATDELMEDAPRLNDRLTRKAGQAIAWKADEAIMWGTGVGQPLGWMKSNARVVVAKESGQAAATIVRENVLKMYTRLLRIPGAPAVWKAHPDILPQLAVMTVGDQPVWTPPREGLTAAPGGLLLGLPIQWSEHAQTLGTEGDLQLVVPMGYHAARKAAGVSFATSMHLYFDYAMTAFRWTFRLGGQPYLSAAVSPAKGSTSRSHFVALATRS